ncbi:MAG: 50S ribosomal protein L11 methyltransferase, partial [Burkholderiaceae bacterium]
PDPSAVVLELDPGLAFGTGSHPTTHLCMEWLEAELPAGASVLDYGCGSGILGILAKKLGAGTVCGVDIDPQAIEAARQNAQRNGCELTVCLPDAFAAAFPGTRFDVVVANILAGPLAVMAPMLAGRLAPRGRLILSGILVEQADDIIAAYRPFLDMAVAAEKDGWVAMSGRPSPHPARPAAGDSE